MESNGSSPQICSIAFRLQALIGVQLNPKCSGLVWQHSSPHTPPLKCPPINEAVQSLRRWLLDTPCGLGLAMSMINSIGNK